MEFITASVQKIIDTSNLAKTKLNEHLKSIRSRKKETKITFENKIASHLGLAKMGDSKTWANGAIIITEYASEINLNPIQAMMTSALHHDTIAHTKKDIVPALGPDEIASYATLLHAIKEAAKSSFTQTESTLFNMHRLAPGHFLFLYALSLTLQDEKNFGHEAVTSTIIYYQFLYNPEDKNQQAVFDKIQIEKENYLNMKKMKSELLDQLAKDYIDFDTWKQKDDAFSIAIAEAKARLEATQFE